ncbi:decaprenyl-phosphate phosphoribosyltransferase [Paenibacillus dendritiformis]|uniref:decaprenyl-phosphate phosphoribosyltransferase n=1 Tax=Paenibacillus dendritiformis TaxID=130049 RepID=UPI003657DE60
MGVKMSLSRIQFSPEKNYTKKNTMILLFVQLRPKQWVKNLLVFAALIFSIKISNLEMLYNSVIAFTLFCLVSSCVYILNDFLDREADSNHPIKKKRPMASGALNPYLALILGFLLLCLSLTFSYYLNIHFFLVLAVYFITNLLYSLRLKHIVIIDVMSIAAGFVLRAVAGGLAINVPFTPWFLICILLLSLFLAISKRRQELFLYVGNKEASRKVLRSYSTEFLDQLNSIVTTATIISYSLFTFTSNHTIYLMWTIPFVIYGIFRYLYLIHIEEKGEMPDKMLFEDKHILITVCLYAVSVISILYYFD